MKKKMKGKESKKKEEEINRLKNVCVCVHRYEHVCVYCMLETDSQRERQKIIRTSFLATGNPLAEAGPRHKTFEMDRKTEKGGNPVKKQQVIGTRK